MHNVENLLSQLTPSNVGNWRTENYSIDCPLAVRKEARTRGRNAKKLKVRYETRPPFPHWIITALCAFTRFLLLVFCFRAHSRNVTDTISGHITMHINICKYAGEDKQTPWSLVRKWTIPTDWPPLVDEIEYQLLWIETCRVVSAADPPRPLITVF
jgi:hypothetical protein